MDYKKRIVSRDDFYKERQHFLESGRYSNPSDVTGYVKSIEGEEPRKAVRLYEEVIHDNLTAAKPDYEVVDGAIGGLKRLGAGEEAKGFERAKESKLKAAVSVAMMRQGWDTEVRKQVRAGIEESRIRRRLKAGAARVVLIGAVLGIITISTKSITGNVIGAARTSANWGLILGLIALLSGLFLILNSKKEE